MGCGSLRRRMRNKRSKKIKGRIKKMGRRKKGKKDLGSPISLNLGDEQIFFLIFLFKIFNFNNLFLE